MGGGKRAERPLPKRGRGLDMERSGAGVVGAVDGVSLEDVGGELEVGEGSSGCCVIKQSWLSE